MQIWRACFAIALGLSVTRAGAQAADTADAPAPQRVEIKAEAASDTELRRRDPVAKTIYGRDELDKYGDNSVSDVLKRLPGVNMQGGNPRLRGLGASYTLILINGEPAPPGFSLENLPPSQVERIEVTKGPTAEFSTQAVAGTINIILREATRQRQRELRVALGYSAERPVLSFNGTWADRLGPLGISLPVSGYQWRGAAKTFSERDELDAELMPRQVQARTQDRWWGHGMTFGPRLNWKVDEAWSFDSLTFLQRNDYNSAAVSLIDLIAGANPSSVDDRSATRGHWQLARSSLTATRRWPDGAKVEARVGGQRSSSRSTNHVIGLNAAGEQSIDRHTEAESSEQGRSTSGKYSRPLFEAHSLSLGWDLDIRRRYEVRSVTENGVPQLPGIEGEPFRARVERAALYVQDEWEFAPQWSTYIGLRGERIASSSANSEGELRSTSSVITPLWHLNYRLDAKGRDLVRASLTRSYRAPDLNALMARRSINSTYPITGPNPELYPDRVGNPALKPELSTGFDLAFEKYLSGGVLSVGVFYRSIDGLIRNVVSLEPVQNNDGSVVQRWVSRPTNLSHARSTGVEFEAKGRAAELLPAALAVDGLALRASLSMYRSRVDGIPGPDNRLEQQQPWSATLGFDHRMAGTPLGFGGNLAYTPAYQVQQTVAQLLELGLARAADAYVMWTFSPEANFRLSVNNFAPPVNVTTTRLVDQTGLVQSNTNRRQNLAAYNASLSLKF